MSYFVDFHAEWILRIGSYENYQSKDKAKFLEISREIYKLLQKWEFLISA